MRKLRVAVIRATGAVGKEMFDVLEKRRFPVGELLAFASERSEGKEMRLGQLVTRAQRLKPGCFNGVDIAFFDASDAISKEWVPQAAESGAWVVDNSATYRMEKDVPLCVPEVNAAELEGRLKRQSRELSARERIIAGPNCTTVQLVVALKPIRDRWGMRRLVISSYQATSGAGAAARDELRDQTRAMLEGKAAESKVFAHPIAFNCIPHIGGFKDDGYTSEEHKLMAETKKILAMPGLRVSATAVRVPTYACHGETANVECERAFELEEVREALRAQPGVVLQDEPVKNLYPMGAYAAGQDAVYVGRVRRDTSLDHGLNLWIVSDNLRKGAALNAVQIGEILLKSLQ